MRLKQEITDYLNHSLNESRITEFKLNEENKMVTIILETIAINNDGTVPNDSRLKFEFKNVGRIASLLKLGEWDNDNAEILKLTPEKLSKQILEFNGDSMYGWEFINVEKYDVEFEKWKHKASFDIKLQEEVDYLNTIDIFSEHLSENCKTLDLKIWFDDLKIKTIQNQTVSLQEFIDRGIRGWNAIYDGNNNMTEKHGIVALAEEKKLRTTMAIVNTGFWSKFKSLFN